MNVTTIITLGLVAMKLKCYGYGQWKESCKNNNNKIKSYCRLYNRLRLFLPLPLVQPIKYYTSFRKRGHVLHPAKSMATKTAREKKLHPCLQTKLQNSLEKKLPAMVLTFLNAELVDSATYLFYRETANQPTFSRRRGYCFILRFSKILLLGFTWRHGGHVGVLITKEFRLFPLFGTPTWPLWLLSFVSLGIVWNPTICAGLSESFRKVTETSKVYRWWSY